MAKKYFLDKRTLLNIKPLGAGNVNTNTTIAASQTNVDNALDLEQYIKDIVDDPNTEFTSINVDTINESTAANGVTVDGVSLKDGKVVISKGTVTQLTSITTGVTLNKPSGVITTVSTTVAAGSNASFTVTNSFCQSNSVVLLTVDDSATAGLAKLNVQSVANGSFVINVTNIHSANAFNNILKIHFLIV